ncbi:hypothetical protein CR513_07124, partial [Mucuna pruriens]
MTSSPSNLENWQGHNSTSSLVLSIVGGFDITHILSRFSWNIGNGKRWQGRHRIACRQYKVTQCLLTTCKKDICKDMS